MSGTENPPHGEMPAGEHDPGVPSPVASPEPVPPVPTVESSTSAPPLGDAGSPFASAPFASAPPAVAPTAVATPAVAASDPGGLPPLLAPGSTDPVDGYGWPVPEDARQGGGEVQYYVAPPTAPPQPARPERHSRNPVDRLTRGLPHGLRITIDWVVTIVGAVAEWIHE